MQRLASVTGKDGLRGTIEGITDDSSPTQRRVLIRLADGKPVMIPASLLERRAEGVYYLPFSRAEIEQGELSEELADNTTRTIPVVEEEVDVSKRVVSNKVRITKRVSEREEQVDVPLLQERAEIKRVAVNKYVERVPKPRTEGDTLIIPLVKEVLVLEKRLLLTEEIHISRQRETTHHRESVTLKSEEIDIDRDRPQEKQRGAS